MDSEFHSLLRQQTWSLVSPPTDKNIVTCKWVYKLKRNCDGIIVRYKAIEDKFFTPHEIYFIGNSHHINKLWILEKPLLKPKRALIHKMTLKLMVQNPWQYYLIKGHSSSSRTTSHFQLMIEAHESHQGNFGSRGLEGQEVCSVKLQQFKVDKGKHVA